MPEETTTSTGAPAGRTPRGNSARPPLTAPQRTRRIVVWSAVVVVALVALVGSLVYTEQSSFCGWCHEMQPYYAAWRSGGHATSAQCVDCHLDAGIIAHLAHKPLALKEVWDHFFGTYSFPNYTVDMPNSRCERCHVNVPSKAGALFSHHLHETKAKCKECHAIVGHQVSLDSLAAMGVLKSTATTPPVPGGLTPSVAPGHIKVVCQDCHDQAGMKCTTCHQAPHEPRGECSNCHHPGSAFRFVHPTVPTGVDCSKCHTLPVGHRPVTGLCSNCHRVPGTGWVFVHPASATNCVDCHTPPANHFGPNCSSCHSPNVPFVQAVFNHPANTGDHSFRDFPCVKCHPNNVYTSASCTCHGGRAPNSGG